MAIFKNTPDEWHRLDWLILQIGPVSFYWKQEVLDNDINWLKNENYDIVEFDCKTWISHNEIHKQLKQKLQFPDYYGENYDALNDCLHDLEILNTGLAIVFRHLDSIDGQTIKVLLDIFAENSRLHLLFGERLIILSQVDNPDFNIEGVGATSVMWNGAEFHPSKRQ